MKFAIYDLSTGEILSLQEKDVIVEGQGSLSLAVFPADYIFQHFVLADELALRPVSSVALLNGVISFTNTHPAAVATINNADGDAMEFSPQDMSLTTPGWYYVKVVQPFPYYTINEAFEHA
jgi:hypothetical protein